MSIRPVPSDDSARGAAAPEGPEDDHSRTCANGQHLNDHRSHWRAIAKRLARAAAGECEGIAAALRPAGISDSHARKLVNASDPMPLVFGDVLAADRTFALTLMRDAIELLGGEEKTPVNASLESIQRKASRDVGAFAEELDLALAGDNRITADEAKRLLRLARQNRNRWDDAIQKLEEIT